MGRPRLCPRRLMASRGGEINTEDPPWVIRLFNRQHTTRLALLRSKWHQRNKQFYPSGIPSLQEPPLEINSRLWIVFTQRREKPASYPLKKNKKNIKSGYRNYHTTKYSCNTNKKAYYQISIKLACSKFAKHNSQQYELQINYSHCGDLLNDLPIS